MLPNARPLGLTVAAAQVMERNAMIGSAVAIAGTLFYSLAEVTLSLPPPRPRAALVVAITASQHTLRAGERACTEKDAPL